jgi:hypothetical protein
VYGWRDAALVAAAALGVDIAHPRGALCLWQRVSARSLLLNADRPVTHFPDLDSQYSSSLVRVMGNVVEK